MTCRTTEELLQGPLPSPSTQPQTVAGDIPFDLMLQGFMGGCLPTTGTESSFSSLALPEIVKAVNCRLQSRADDDADEFLAGQLGVM